jgi:ArsR family transcriptional regulator
MATAAVPQTKQAVRWFHALSDETRLEIVRMLSHGERCVCELQAALDAAQSRLSFHLKVLKDAKLVVDRRDGRWVHYRLSPEALEGIESFAAAIRPGAHAGSCRSACCD